MELKYSDLAESQLDNLSLYLEEWYGRSVAIKKMSKLSEAISCLTTFKDMAPEFIIYRGYTIRRMVSTSNYIFYTERNNAIHILSIFDTRTSPQNIKRIITQQIERLNEA